MGLKMRTPRSRRSASFANIAPMPAFISYDARRNLEWPQVAREIIAAEKPKVIVMMIGNNIVRRCARSYNPTAGI